MRSTLTVLAVCGVLAVPAALATDYTWDGGGDDAFWSNALNWIGDEGYPSTSDLATIAIRGNGWPALDGDGEVAELVMLYDAELDLGGNSFECKTLTVLAVDAPADVWLHDGGTFGAGLTSIEAAAGYSAALTLGTGTWNVGSLSLAGYNVMCIAMLDVHDQVVTAGRVTIDSDTLVTNSADGDGAVIGNAVAMYANSSLTVDPAFSSVTVVTAGQAKYFYGGESWNSGNWYNGPQGTGGSTSKATSGDVAILEAHCCLDQNESCQELVVRAGVTLYLDDFDGTGYRLTVGSTDTKGGQISTIEQGASIKLREDDSDLAFQYNHVLRGDGRIQGEHNGATISVRSGKVLTSTTSIKGALEINAEGAYFVNNGLVEADDGAVFSDTLRVHRGTIVGFGDWRVTGTGACLAFSATLTSATGLAGEFTVRSGLLDIDEPLHTTGRLIHYGGTVDASAAAGFATVSKQP